MRPNSNHQTSVVSYCTDGPTVITTADRLCDLNTAAYPQCQANLQPCKLTSYPMSFFLKDFFSYFIFSLILIIYLQPTLK